MNHFLLILIVILVAILYKIVKYREYKKILKEYECFFNCGWEKF